MKNTVAKQWIRLYTDALQSRKVQALPSPVFKFWVNCLLFSGTSENGTIPSVVDIAWCMREKEDRIEAWIEALEVAGLLDRKPDGLIPHNWLKRQYEVSPTTVRTRKFRERNSGSAERSGNVSGTFRERSSRASDLFCSESVSVSGGAGGNFGLELEELDSAWERHHKHIRGEPKDLAFGMILAMNGTFDLARFRDRHPRFCATWDQRDWQYCPLTFLGWVQAGMPEPPPMPVKDLTVRELREKAQREFEAEDSYSMEEIEERIAKGIK